MHTLYLTMLLIAEAEVGEAVEQAPPSMMPSFLLFGIIFFVFWFVVISPQKKAQNEQDTMRKNLKKGDDIVTIGGLHGQVVGAEEQTVTLRINPKVEVVLDRSAVARKVAHVEKSPEQK